MQNLGSRTEYTNRINIAVDSMDGWHCNGIVFEHHIPKNMCKLYVDMGKLYVDMGKLYVEI